MKQLAIEDVTIAPSKAPKARFGCPYWTFNYKHYEEQCKVTGALKMYETDPFNYCCDFEYDQCPEYIQRLQEISA